MIMKVFLSVLVLYAASLCIYGTNLRTVKLREEGQLTRIALIDIDSVKNDTRIGTTLTKADLVCPKRPSTSPDAPIRERALCPWQLNATYDETRKPRVIEEAVCLCKGCLQGGTCSPVYAPINIFKIMPTGDWEVKMLNITVACECRLNSS